MKLLADAHISRSMLGWLRGQGHDVAHAAELPPGTSDSAILELAEVEGRVILTADKDFGELVFRQLRPATGVILLRLTLATEVERVARLEQAWGVVEAWASGNFVVVGDRSIRRTPLPA